MDDFHAKLCEFRADIRLRDKYPRADRANTFERPEPGNHRRCRRPLQPFDPVRNGIPELLDRIVINEPRIVRHVSPLFTDCLIFVWDAASVTQKTVIVPVPTALTRRRRQWIWLVSMSGY